MKQFTPKISIIIPVYNMEKYLDDCISSVLKQTYNNLEILLVNDGSTDQSPMMCDYYALQNPNIKVIHKENGGLISAWSEGVYHSTGDYLCFLDSDDWIDSEMISDLAEHLSGNCKEIVCSNYIIEKKNQSIPVIQSMPPGVYNRKDIEEKIFPRLLGKEYRSIHCSRCMKLFSKILFTDNMKYSDSRLTFGEDLNIVLPVILDAERIIIIEKGLYYHYRFVDASMAHKYSAKLYGNIQLLYNALHSTLISKAPDLPSHINWEDCLKKEYIFLTLYAVKNELRCPDQSYLKRIPEICAEAHSVVNDIAAEIQSQSSRLLYRIFQDPTKINLYLGRLAIKIFDAVS